MFVSSIWAMLSLNTDIFVWLTCLLVRIGCWHHSVTKLELIFWPYRSSIMWNWAHLCSVHICLKLYSWWIVFLITLKWIFVFWWFFFNFFGLVGFNLCSVRKKSDICLLFSFICLEYLCPSFHPKICPVFDGKAHFLEAVNNIDLFFNPVCQLMVHPFVRLSSF